MEYPKKLIEVALPLDDINIASAREKSIRHGHPSTLHLWWARRPLAAARAVLFAQLVNDPGGKRGYGRYKGQTKADAYQERERLFQIIRDLVKWENTNNEEVLERARAEIRKSWRETCEITGDDPEKMPPFLDPFAGGGSIPLEAQRLGLEAHASDLNPVAVMINKAMIEIPPKFAGREPVGPVPENEKQNKFKGQEDWSGAKGLAEDVRRYGHWMREEAWKRIGHLYPEADLPKEYGGGKATVIAWLWARTVASPNPAMKGAHVPLISNFFLSTKKGKEVYVKPVIEGNNYRFIVVSSMPYNPEEVKSGTKLGRGANFHCLLSETPISSNYIKEEGMAGRMGAKLMAIVVDGGKNGRIYLSPISEMERIASQTKPAWLPTGNVPERLSGGTCFGYGLTEWSKLFTSRQLVALTTFSDLIRETHQKIIKDSKLEGWDGDKKSLTDGGLGARAYADAIATYLAFQIDQISNQSSAICGWNNINQQMIVVFSRQALPMNWDFAESNPFSKSTGSLNNIQERQIKGINALYPYTDGTVSLQDAKKVSYPGYSIISTDPPYYDNIFYADLSDYFYVWLRKSLKFIYPDLFVTLFVPKEDELVATPFRHGGKKNAEKFFISGMKKALHKMATNSHPFFPVTIYYAFKQSDTKQSETSSRGWEAFMEAVIKSGFVITGTWPLKTESANKLKAKFNVLASSIVIVCRKRSEDVQSISRKQFLRELETTLPDALEDMIGGKENASPIAPVDLAQAAIGPGMAVFSKYESVLEADGSPMTVHDALILINRAIDEYFNEAESNMEAETRFCVDWFQQYGFKEGAFGEADVLARAKGTTVDGVQNSGVIQSGKGKVRLLKTDEYPSDWNPAKDFKIPIWEACHHLCRALKQSETEAGTLLAKMMEKTEAIRQLAYRLYTLCERKGWAEDARRYNELIIGWHSIVKASQDVGISHTQKELF